MTGDGTEGCVRVKVRRVVAAATLCASFAASGCGGDGSSASAGFIAQANAACRQSNDAIRGLPRPPGSGLSLLAVAASESRAIGETLARKLQLLTPPAEDRSRWQQLLANLDATLRLLAQMQAAAESGDASSIPALSQAIDAKNSDQIAKNLGLSDCAQNAQPNWH